MSGRLPCVFISSTCFDLKQVRADLARFIEHDLGYRFLASEFPSFPVDPSLQIIENCRRQVENEADIFVLIVGSRYGSVEKASGKSVTNIEYIAARAKGSPVFAFIASDVQALLPVFERNPDADFSTVIDSPSLLQFVSELRGSSGVWTFKFELVQDIIAALRTQLAYQMMRGLALSGRAREHDRILRTLSGAAFRLAAERPLAWEPLLLLQVIEDEFAAAADLRRDHNLGIALGTGERLPDEAMPGWVASLMSEARRLVEAIERVAVSSLDTALTNGEAEPIVYGARQIGRVYREGLGFITRIRRADVPEEWEPIRSELTHLLDEVFAEFDEFAPRVKHQIEEALSSPAEGTVRLPLKLTFRVSNVPKLLEMLRELKERRGITADVE
jgi:hypothetical protein